MKNSVSIFVFSALMGAVSSCANKDDSKAAAADLNEEKFADTGREHDSEFAVEAADLNLLEVQLGNLAIANATSPQVKQFAVMIVDEHNKASEELKSIARASNISIPATLSERGMKTYNHMVQKKGTAFDTEYIDLMVNGHEQAIQRFKEEADEGKDSLLSGWASEKLSILQHHLQLAHSAKETLKNSNR
jgi:putative membrane protein